MARPLPRLALSPRDLSGRHVRHPSRPGRQAGASDPNPGGIPWIRNNPLAIPESPA
ncbi:hypothetical protein CBM2634_A80089 [Cupriavidus taiwanensis]|uniref:Uncharacterized protein n=1 Tax=Cupriavidus taiwanensis TaxID=164546 RepID=A0A375J213_9BURK|nr:hypothetical protein CBM2634_A80089 [Cupriavidus taiwanensis]